MSCKHNNIDGQLYLDENGMFEIEPCVLEVKEVWKNVTVEVSECPVCGKVSIGWYKQPNTLRIPVYEEE